MGRKVCLTKSSFKKEHKKLVGLLLDTSSRLRKEGLDQRKEARAQLGKKKRP
jgi:hypothetical protein